MRASSAWGGAVDQVGGALAVGPHAHVERAVAHEREAALGLVDLHRRDPEVEGHAPAGRTPASPSAASIVRIAALDQPEAPGTGGAQRLGETLDRRVAVEGETSRAALQEGAAVAAGAEGAVDDQVAGLGRQRLERPRRAGRDGAAPFMTPLPPDAPAAAGAGPRSPALAAARCSRAGRRKASRSQIWKRSPKPHDHHPVGQAERLAQALGQGDAAGGVEGELRHAAEDAWSPARSAADRRTEARRSAARSGRTAPCPPPSRQSASMEGKQKTPSKGPAAAARNSCGTTMRRLASSCFSKVERNTPPRPPTVRRPILPIPGDWVTMGTN